MSAADGATANRAQRPSGWGWLVGAVWLVYLGDPLTAALDYPREPARAVGVAAVAVFAAVYLGVMGAARRHRLAGTRPPGWVPRAQIAGLLLLAAAMLPAAQQHALAAGVFAAAAAMFTLPVRSAWALAVALAVGAELAVRLVPGWHETGPGLGVLLAAVAVFAIRLAFDRNERLVETRVEMARLAVSAERSRFARDLHDILGHSLTVITVKAELAGRLVHIDPDRAAAEIADLERLSRDALADVRQAVAGYREVTLSGELATARESLAAAGIEADLPTAVDEVPGPLRELFGWAVREGVTNVIRHSGASRCTVRVAPDSVEVLDDGVGPPPTDGARPATAAGHGLVGLRERAETAGASVHVERFGPDRGFRLRLTGPVQAAQV